MSAPIRQAQGKRKGNILLIIVSGIALVAIVAAGYFWYQNQQLKKESSILNQGSSKLVPSTTPTPTADETANWKTYSDKDSTFIFRYPTAWKVDERKNGPEFSDSFLEMSLRIHNTAGQDYLNQVWQIKECNGTEPYIFCDPIPFRDIKTMQINSNTVYWRRSGDNAVHAYLRSASQNKIVELYTITLNNERLFTQILSTFKFLNTTSPTPTPAPIAAVKTLTYYLPTGWKTIQTLDGSFEIGYDPNLYGATANNGIEFRYNKGIGSFSFSIQPYDAGSRHQFIYKQLNMIVPSSKTPDYHEQEYSYNGWSCLVLYGLTFSAKGTTWGMCPVSATQAIFIEGPGPESVTEPLIRTIKLLK